MTAPTTSRQALPVASFADWRARLDRDRIAPVIAIGGSRGKTSVLRAVESILRTGEYRFASWTDRGVEIEGERQRGELGPWSRALTRLAAGGLDVALQELDWSTVQVQTLGARGSSYPVVALANLCANNEACLVTPEALQDRKALHLLRNQVAPSGRLVFNADDFALAEDFEGSESKPLQYLVGLSADTPVLRRHLNHGGDASWVANSTIMIQEHGRTRALIDSHSLQWTRKGHIPFAMQNALIATSIARSCGLPDRLIAAGLMSHTAQPESMPGSFNVFDFGSATIVVDRPMPSWFLRSSLRAAVNLGRGRQIRVVGPMPGIANSDVFEVGRLMARNGGVLILHGVWDANRLERMRQGAAVNEVPPIVIQASDERTAVQQAISMLRPDDVLLVLAEHPSATVRLVQRRIRQDSVRVHNSVGAMRAS